MNIVIYIVLAACGIWLIFVRGKKPIEKVGFGLVLLGLTILNTVDLYYLHTYRMSPHFPDSIHSIKWEEHGHKRFVLPSQDKLVWYSNITGLAVLFPGGVLLFTGGRHNKRNTAR